jgi:hypothetical protein
MKPEETGHYSVLGALGYSNRAYDSVRQLRATDPLNTGLGRRDQERAMALLREVVATPIGAFLAPVLDVSDSSEAARELLRRIFAESGDLLPPQLHYLSPVASYFGDTELAFVALKTAIDVYPTSSNHLWRLCFAISANSTNSGT